MYTSIYMTKTYWYAWNVVYGEGTIIANNDVTNACKRFLNDLDRAESEDFPFYFDLSMCNRLEDLSSCMKFTSGARAGERIDLAPPQTFVLDNLYAWRYKDNPKKRRFRSGMIMKARKNAKTFDLSFISIMAMLDEMEAEVYSVASKKDQAAISFRQCRSMIASNPKASKKFKLNRSEIILKTNNSTFKYLASEEKTLDGISPSVGIIDEAFVTPEGVRSSISSGTGARLSPLIVGISTSYDVKMVGNWAFDEMEYTQKVNSGEFENERHFGVIYGLDSVEEVDDEAMWEKANPLLPYSDTLLDSLREDYKKAKVNSALMRNFKIKNMNMILDGTGINRYLALPAWENLTESHIDFAGKWIFFGLDLSITTDLCAVSICTYNEELDAFDIKVHAFLPSENIRELEIADGVPYRQYSEEGYITLVDGPVIEQEWVYQWCNDFAAVSNANIAMFAYDPYNSDYIMKRCEEEGHTTLQIFQGYRMLSGPTKTFREFVYRRRIRHEFNPIFNWCVSNAITSKDKFNNEILDKVKSTNKIDLVAASIFAFLACDKNKEYYFNRDYSEYMI